jgi:phosphopantothenoylcysteine decarboxylase/phosphopantothenate--cysteine ligase
MENRKIIFVITGGIASYKICNLVSELTQQGADIRVVMTESATKLIGPKTFQSLSRNKVYTDLWSYDYDIPHTELSSWAELLVIAPATANIIAKARMGIADDLASTLILAFDKEVVCAPSMNNRMFEKRQTKENIQYLRECGWTIVGPQSGFLACGEEGIGRLAELDEIKFSITKAITSNDLEGRKVLITAGGTREYLDPVRFLGNPSSGKMGLEIARMAKLLGATVTLVGANIMIKVPEYYYDEYIEVVSAEEMADKVLGLYKEQDVVLMNSAVSDYSPVIKSDNKIKKTDKDIEFNFKLTRDILKEITKKRNNKQIIVGFAAETEDMEKNAKKKLLDKNIDMICANLVGVKDSGFAVETSRAVLIIQDEVEDLGLITKRELAIVIMKKVVELLKRR